jgi:hypothetical protein
VKKLIAFKGRSIILKKEDLTMEHDDRAEELHEKIRNLRDELKAHAEEVDNPKCAALCETSAEVMGGLETAFDHFLEKSEKAWEDA